jgi:hypothetical protein
MKKLTTTLLALTLVLSFSSVMATDNPKEKPEAPTTSLTGMILDAQTGEALAGVSVKIEGSDVEAYTDFDGVFQFDGILPGEYTISATMISYKKESSKLEVNLNNENDLKLNLDSVSQK